MKMKIIFFIIISLFICFDFSYADNSSNSGSGSQKEELTGDIRFYVIGKGEVSVSLGKLWGTPLMEGQYGESVINEFVNDDIEVTLYCTSKACESNTYDKTTLTGNGVGSLSITDKYGRTLTKNYHVRKINKSKPTGELTYYPGNDIWVNSSKIVKLNGEATVFGNELYNRDWLVGNASPTYYCSTTGGCKGEISITDSAGNILNKNFEIKNIDKEDPTMDVDLEIVASGATTQNITIKCHDTGGSGCSFDNKSIVLPLGIATNQCVSDKAGNITCLSFNTAASSVEFSDTNMAWTAGNRKIYLICKDNIGGSGCTKNEYSNIINNNTLDTSLTISDLAGNTLTKHFQISKIDKESPNININGPANFMASDLDKITIKSDDSKSGLKRITYNWNNTCKSGSGIIGTKVNSIDKINFTQAGIQKLFVCAIDNVGNINEVNQNFLIYPGELDQNQSELHVNSMSDKYANGNDKYLYYFLLKDKYGNIIYNKNIDSINYSIGPNSKILVTDMVDMTSGDSALDKNIINLNSNKDGKINFSLSSISPGEFTQMFEIKMKGWNDDYIQNSSDYYSIIKSEISNKTNKFLQPIYGEIKIIEGGSIPEIGKNQKYQIVLKKVNNNNIIVSSGNLNISKSTIINKTSGHFWRKFGDVDNYFGNNLNNYLGFSGSIDANSNVLASVNLITNKLIISYDINGKFVKYYMDNFGINGCNTDTLGVQVIGLVQGDGKSEITGQEKNFSDISKLGLRTIIRKNGYNLVKSMTSGTILNGVKYVKGDVIISGDQNYETLVVEEGNVIISGNLNLSNKKFGIIVLKDNYSINNDYNKKGNIFVDNNVSTINAIIYSDGAFRSADKFGNNYQDGDLNLQLKLKGSLFSRNTIGGAVLAGGYYLLPGGEKTIDYDLAELYDLNYMRKLKDSCGIASFILEYNSNIQTDPPKGFGSN